MSKFIISSAGIGIMRNHYKWPQKKKNDEVAPEAPREESYEDRENHLEDEQQTEGKVNGKQQNTRPSRTLNVNTIQHKDKHKNSKIFYFQHYPTNLCSTFLSEKTCHLINVKFRFDISFQYYLPDLIIWTKFFT